MKWNQPGHEFDDKAVKWCRTKTVFIYGLSYNAKELEKMLRFTQLSEKVSLVFVDSNVEKQESGYHTYPVISLPDMLKMIEEHSIDEWVIADCTAGATVSSLLQCFDKIRFGENLFSFEIFIKSFLPVLLWYKFGKSFCPSAAIHFSTHCNLKCAGCGVFTERYYPKKDRDIDEIYADIDVLFSKFDYVYHAGTCGGEPFLFRRLPDLIRYATKYAHKFFTFGNVTNGTIPMSESLLLAYKELNKKSPYAKAGISGGGGNLTIDDYSENVPASRPEEILALCQAHGIKVKKQKYTNWVDFRVMKANHTALSAGALTAFHDVCNNSCWWLCDGKFYTCGMTLSASHAGFIPDEDNNSIDLYKCTIPEFLEFQAGFTQKGFFELCKHCDGYVTVNKNYIEAAKQS